MNPVKKRTMKAENDNHDEAIRRIASFSKLEAPSAGFAARVMDRLLAQPEPVQKWIIRYQYGIFAIAAGVAILMMLFPAWTLFDFDIYAAGASVIRLAGNFLHQAVVWVLQLIDKIPPIGKYAYFIPASIALLIIATFDQIISRKPQTDTAK